MHRSRLIETKCAAIRAWRQFNLSRGPLPVRWVMISKGFRAGNRHFEEVLESWRLGLNRVHERNTKGFIFLMENFI